MCRPVAGVLPYLSFQRCCDNSLSRSEPSLARGGDDEAGGGGGFDACNYSGDVSLAVMVTVTVAIHKD
jgi:hypothetical protein